MLKCLATVISSVLDHARASLQNPWLWVPTIAGILGTVVAMVIGVREKPRRADLIIFTAAMLLLIVVGAVGAVLHIDAHLIAQGTIIEERFIRGEPFLAPLLFTNLGTLGPIALLDPASEKSQVSPRP